MALRVEVLNTGAVAMAGELGFMQLHSGDPGTSGANECTSARRPVVATVDGATIQVPAVQFDDLTPDEPVTHIGFWSAATGGTFLGGFPLTGDTAANGVGQYWVNPGTITGA